MKTTIKAILVILSVTFFSCQKNDDLSTSLTDLTDVQLKSATLAVNDVAVESVAEEANYETYFFGEYEHLLRGLAHMKGNNHNLFASRGNMHYMNGQAPVVSIDTAETGYPIVITIDYGTSTETQHGRVINGKVEIEISGPKNTYGTIRTITYIGCVIDSIGIEGSSTETFSGDNLATRMSTITSDVTYTLPDGTVITRVGEKVREWLQGVDTPMDRTDDMIQITGTMTVTTPDASYVRYISDPLIRLGDCHHAVQGIVEFSSGDVVLASLDYGDGTCDNFAELTTEGATVEITLKDRGMPKAKTDGMHQHMGENNGGMGNNGMGNRNGKH